jgi:ankyrin repeat protein
METIISKENVFDLIDKKKYETLANGLKNDSLEKLNMAGIPPLVYATKKKDLTALKLLLKYENLESADQDGRTALHYAVLLNLTLAVEYLLHNGASLETTDRFGKTPRDVTSHETDRAIVDMINPKY